MLKSKSILIGIGGGIAAYKVCEVISSLFQEGAEVRVILTETAQRFITPLTVATLIRHIPIKIFGKQPIPVLSILPWEKKLIYCSLLL